MSYILFKNGSVASRVMFRVLNETVNIEAISGLPRTLARIINESVSISEVRQVFETIVLRINESVSIVETFLTKFQGGRVTISAGRIRTSIRSRSMSIFSRTKRSRIFNRSRRIKGAGN